MLAKDEAAPNVCPGCGSSFRCGPEAGAERCWCGSLPPLPQRLPGAACYCPACLSQALEDQRGLPGSS